MLLQLLPELLELLPRGLQIGTIPIAWWKVHLVIQADRRESGIEILRLDIRRQQRRHVRIAGRASAGDEVSPHALAQLEILHFVELGETWRHAGLDRALAQQTRAE